MWKSPGWNTTEPYYRELKVVPGLYADLSFFLIIGGEHLPPNTYDLPKISSGFDTMFWILIRSAAVFIRMFVTRILVHHSKRSELTF